MTTALTTLYVIGYRKWRGKKYRTRYFRECFDGRPRMGTHRQAAVFNAVEVQDIAAQLTQLQPKRNWQVFFFTERPVRYTGPPPAEEKKPTQTEFEGTTNAP